MKISRLALIRMHGFCGALAFVLILSFLTASLVAEAGGSYAAIAQVKSAIAYALLILIPSLVIAAASGRILAGPSPHGLIARKLRRMMIVAPNGLFVLLPAALFLSWKASSGQFDLTFMGIQAIEFIAGAVNLALLALNLRDGLVMKRGRLALQVNGN